MSFPQSHQSKGDQPWKPHPPPRDKPRIAKAFSKPQPQNLCAARMDARIVGKTPSVRATVPSAPIAAGRNAYNPFHFFHSELEKVQLRFNETFGRQVTINVQFRSKVMLAIINLMLLHRKIIIAKKPEAVPSEIAHFITCSRNLYGIFDQLEVLTQIRRNNHDEKQIA